MIVDASVWVSYFVQEDKFHAQTVTWLEGLGPNDTVSGPMLLLPELAGAITRRTKDATLGRETVRQVLAWPSLVLVPLGDDLLLLAAELAAALALKGADAIYVAAAWTAGIPLVTWDAEQQTRARDVVSVCSPADLAQT